MRLQGKRAVVTGGGRGIGAEVARELAREGCQVMVASRNLVELEALAEELTGQGAPVFAQFCDVSDAASIVLMAEAAREKMGGVDILVNSAGIANSTPVKSLSLEEWNRILSVNATGTFLCTQAFLGGMVEASWGRVVNVASVASRVGGKYLSAYAASKHAVLGFTRSAAEEVARFGVTVNAVCPGFVDTPMTVATIERIVQSTGRSQEQAREALMSLNPQGRLIEPEEVAYAVLCLCHPRARGINGQALVVDGGGLLS